MVDGYLLDTNHVRYWYDKHPRVVGHLSKLDPETPLRVSVITLGEMEYGHKVASPSGATVIQSEFKQFVATALPIVIPVSTSTTPHYGEIRARLFEKFAPRKKRSGLRPEQLVNPTTGLLLGIQENDIWLSAQAWERNLVLVTNDSLSHIAQVVPEIKLENWAP